MQRFRTKSNRKPASPTVASRFTAFQRINGVMHCVVLERSLDGCYRETEVKPAESDNAAINAPLPCVYYG